MSLSYEKVASSVGGSQQDVIDTELKKDQDHSYNR